MDATHPSSPARQPVRPHVDAPAACLCGQDLDLWTALHCPRCGTQLGAARLEATGFWQAA